MDDNDIAADPERDFDVDVEDVLDGSTGEGLFDDLLSGEPIFENKEVLRPSYTPHELPHRDDQINRMATILVAALRGETPSNILIYGKTGTGKTASAKFVSQELEKTSEKYHNINTGEVYNIYKRLCDELDADVLTQRRVTDLISELDMLGIVNAVVVSKGRYGRTKEISLSVPTEETETVLRTDSQLGDIGDIQPFVQARFDSSSEG